MLEGGNDWQTVRADGTILLDVRLPLKTDDGALIFMSYEGMRSGSAEILAKVDRGEDVDPKDYYFRMQPRFETSAPKYDWLNRLLCVGTGLRTAAGPLYHVFEVL